MFVHIVRPEDRLSTLAGAYGLDVPAILAANPQKPRVRLTSGEEVFASLAEGEALQIPSSLGTFNPDGSVDTRCDSHSVWDSRGSVWVFNGTCLKKEDGSPICGKDLAYWGTTCPKLLDITGGGYVTESSLVGGDVQKDFVCCGTLPRDPQPPPVFAPKPAPVPPLKKPVSSFVGSESTNTVVAVVGGGLLLTGAIAGVYMLSKR